MKEFNYQDYFKYQELKSNTNCYLHRKWKMECRKIYRRMSRNIIRSRTCKIRGILCSRCK